MIEDSVIMLDKEKKPRNFGFVTFNSIESVNNVFLESEHEVDGKVVECKRSVPKEPKKKTANFK